jgi:hypothetical protein
MSDKIKTIHQMTAAECGALVGITDRRVRQLAEAGMLPKQGRGLYDATWFMNLYIGLGAFEGRSRKPDDPRTLVAFSWLCGSKDTWRTDLPLLTELFTRNGYTADDALIAVGEAKTWMRR